MTGRCDVIVGPRGSIYINGTMIERVHALNVDRDAMSGTVMTLELRPTSIVYGDVPNETVEALAMDQTPDASSVDINRAISRAQARAAGFDSLKTTLSAPTPITDAAPVAKRPGPKKASYDVEHVDESPEATCGVGVGGGEVCYRPKGHAGRHSS